MIDISSRHRPLALLAGVIFAQVLLLAFQIKREHDVRLIRLWSVESLTPLQRGANWIFHGIGNGWRHYIDLRHTRVEDEHLRGELERLQVRNRELEGRAAEADRFAKLLGFRETHRDVPMFAAEVIGQSPDATSHTVYVNRGSRDGVRKNMGVITPDGVVGKVVEVYSSTALVLLITDRDSGVGTLLASSRTHGVVKGTGDPLARMEYVVNDENVPVGETVLTSGEDRIFPKDLPVGMVADVQAGNPWKVILVRPVARLDRLEEVFVLQTQQELNLKTDSDAGAAHYSPATAAKPIVPLNVPPGIKLPGSESRLVAPEKTPPSTKPVVKPPANQPDAAAATPKAAKPAATKPPAPNQNPGKKPE
jgi:rod shape-determining protein MreC